MVLRLFLAWERTGCDARRSEPLVDLAMLQNRPARAAG